MSVEIGDVACNVPVSPILISIPPNSESTSLFHFDRRNLVAPAVPKIRKKPPINLFFRVNVFTLVHGALGVVVYIQIYVGAIQHVVLIYRTGTTGNTGKTIASAVLTVLTEVLTVLAVLTEVGVGRREAGGGQEEGEQEGEAEVTHPSGGEPASVGCGLEVRRGVGLAEDDQ